MKSLKKQLNDILLETKLIDEKQLNQALEIRKKKGGRLSDILIELNYISEKDLVACLGEYFDVPPINLQKIKIDITLTQIIPKSIASNYQLVPISKIGKRLTVAMTDPLNIFAIDDIKNITKLDIKPIIATEQDVNETINKLYAPTGDMDDVLKTFKEDTVEVENLEQEEEEDIKLEELFSDTGESPVIKVVNFILIQAIKEKVSDIHIEPAEKKIRVRYRVDGILYEMDSAPPKHLQQAITSRIKIMANLDIAEKRLPQDGRIRIKTDGKEVDFRVSILPTYFGEKIVLRILDKSNLAIRLDALGFDEGTLKKLHEAISHPHGMILVTGPTGSGKTTTLYSALNEVNKEDVNIITVEDPVEYQLEGINQVPVHSDIGLTFSAGLRSILRQDPDIVMIGEIRDLETADIAVKAALTGHLVFSTLHTNDAPGTISRLDDMGIEPFLISSSVILCAAQRLVRKICPSCKIEYEVSAEAMARMGIPLKKGQQKGLLHKGKGCDICKDTGYKGRLALLEVMLLDDEIKTMIIERANASEIKKIAIKNGMETLRMTGINRVLDGLTTVEEVLRVTTADEIVNSEQ